MKKILLIKTSSIGDVIHNLPVVSDLLAMLPGSRIDWVIEESLAAIPALHSGVGGIIPAAVRRWRTSLWRRETRDEIRTFVGRLRETRYDAVIDTQGLMKSALIARAAHGPRYGKDWKSAREPLRVFYDRTFAIPWSLHAVERNRLLCALALDYAVPPVPDYGIRAPAVTFEWLPRRPYTVLLHGTSARRKLWAEDCWVGLGRRLNDGGMHCVLPWGREDERRRSERLAQRIPGATVPPRLDFTAAAALLGEARLVVGLDTGLTHLAGALGTPTVGIFGATDPAATGLYGCARAVNLGGVGSAPSVSEAIAAVGVLLQDIEEIDLSGVVEPQIPLRPPFSKGGR
jgi:heptosyltransferase-1